VTVEQGTNQIVGRDPKKILAAAARVSGAPRRAVTAPELWDGHAAERIVKVLLEKFRPSLLNNPCQNPHASIANPELAAAKCPPVGREKNIYDFGE
jgi:hypothetical protein